MRPGSRFQPAVRVALFSTGLFWALTAACSSAAALVPVHTPAVSSPSAEAADCPDPTEMAAEQVPLCLPGSTASPAVPTLPVQDGGGMGPPPAPLSMPDPTATALAPTALPEQHTPTEQPPIPEATPAPLLCSSDLCVNTAFPLIFPISPPDQDQFDVTYRFATTPGRWRSPHRGVDTQNPQGVPVHAAAGGTVVHAGDDLTTMFGPNLDFYGNLVVLSHSLPGYPEPLYTLYAHLSEVEVTEGELVKAGQEIGKVGMSGVAMGTHLHFEVRLGGLTYEDVLNPELWLAPRQGPDGQQNGGLAGKIVGEQPVGQEVVIERLAGPDGPPEARDYVKVYEVPELIGRPPYEESFAIGNLAPGWYRVTFAQFGVNSQVVEIFPGQLTRVTFHPGES